MHARLDALVAQGPPADLVADFAVPVPSQVIGELLGVPVEDRDELEKCSIQRFDTLGSMEDSLAAVNASLGYLGGLVARYRTDPRPGLLANLISCHGDDLSDRELAELADGLLTGGHETTASMLALGALALLEQPSLADGLRSGRIAPGRLVDELLRYQSVVQVAFPRFATASTSVGGTTLDAGDIVLCSLSGANRDGAFGADPDGIDPDRASRPASRLRLRPAPLPGCRARPARAPGRASGPARRSSPAAAGAPPARSRSASTPSCTGSGASP